MIKEGKFGPQEVIWLIFITLAIKLFYSNYSFLVNLYGNSVWYAIVISNAASAVLFTFTYLLLKRFPGKNIIEIYDVVLGRFLGFIPSGILCILLLLNAGLSARESAEALKIYILPLSPIQYVLGIFTIAVIIVSALGLESIARLSKFFAYMLLTGLFLVLLLGWRNYDYRNIFPLFGFGIGNTVWNGILRGTVFGELLIVAVIAGSLQGVKHIKKAGYIPIVLNAAISSMLGLASVLTFPYYVGREIASPIYEMTRIIDLGTFFQRLDPIFLFIWNITALISVTILFYAAVSTYCKMFRIQDMRPIIIPFAILFFTISLAPHDFSTVSTGYLQGVRTYGGAFMFACPIITLIAAVLRKKKGGAINA